MARHDRGVAAERRGRRSMPHQRLASRERDPRSLPTCRGCLSRSPSRHHGEGAQIPALDVGRATPPVQDIYTHTASRLQAHPAVMHTVQASVVRDHLDRGPSCPHRSHSGGGTLQEGHLRHPTPTAGARRARAVGVSPAFRDGHDLTPAGARCGVRRHRPGRPRSVEDVETAADPQPETCRRTGDTSTTPRQTGTTQ